MRDAGEVRENREGWRLGMAKHEERDADSERGKERGGELSVREREGELIL